MNTEKFLQMLSECNNIVFFGGAGVSTESGVKDYRSEDGLYNTVREYGVSPEEILSHTFFFENPQVFYDFYRKYFITDAKPNSAHQALAELERMGKLKAVITQNIDGLHQKAGSKNVIELHGTANEFFCPYCSENADGAKTLEVIKSGALPKCAHCGGVLKPKVVLYGEPLGDGAVQRAVRSVADADMLIVGGTSLAVYPAASFVEYFKGRYTVMINKTATGYDGNADLIVRDSIGKFFEKIMAEKQRFSAK